MGRAQFYRVKNHEYIFPSGKHKDENIVSVIDSDPQYVKFMIENGYLWINDELKDRLKTKLNAQKK